MARGFALGFQSANAVGSKLIEAGLEIMEVNSKFAQMPTRVSLGGARNSM